LRRLAALLPALRPWFARAAKAKTAKLVRTVVEALARVPGAEATLSRVLTDAVAWAKAVRAWRWLMRAGCAAAARAAATRPLPPPLAGKALLSAPAPGAALGCAVRDFAASAHFYRAASFAFIRSSRPPARAFFSLPPPRAGCWRRASCTRRWRWWRGWCAR
jgi:hypothetical protein